VISRPRATTLANGLRVLLLPMRRTPLVSLWCWYRVGSKDERPGVTGLSHWTEHMNFKGTKRFGRDEITRRVELAGGVWNGYTWLDVTTYFETVRAPAFEEMLRIEASRMTECLYEAKEVDRERTVVISELQGGENDPRTFLEREVTGTALQAHPYRWPTIGYLSDLRSITREDLVRHYRTYYVPNNAILVAAGGFDAAEAMTLVRRHFGKLRKGSLPPPLRTVEPEMSGERRVRLQRPSGAAYVHVAWHAPAAAEADFAVLLMLDGLLAGGPSVNPWAGGGGAPSKASRLHRALVETSLAADFDTSLVPTRHPYLYAVQATASDGVEPGKLEAAIVAEVEALAGGRIEARDLERAREQFLARYALESESVTDVAHQLGYFETIGSHALWLALPARVSKVTAADVARLAKARLDARHRTVGTLVP
jgi:zinc protease